MPIHDWTRAEDWAFRDFHAGWVPALSGMLNRGVLPRGYYSLIQPGEGTVEDFPLTGLEGYTESEMWRRRRRTLSVRRATDSRSLDDHKIVAFVEIVSHIVKEDAGGRAAFVDKIVDALTRGVHVMMIDVLPPGAGKSNGLHAEVWSKITGTPVGCDDAPIVVSYRGGPDFQAHLNPIEVGGPLPETPLFVGAGASVVVPLEASYQAAFDGVCWPTKEKLTGRRS